MYALLAYVPMLVFIPWLAANNDPFVNFHVRQGFVLLAGFILSLIAAAWINAVGSVLFLLLLLADVVALTMALQGRTWKIPGIGTVADKFRV